MTRTAKAAYGFAEARDERRFSSAPEPMSGVHRVPPSRGAETFSAWVAEQLAGAPSPRAEVERLEAQLVLALQGRDVPAALMCACAIAYLDPGHRAARRIKRRCAREMRRDAASAESVPRMVMRWSDLRDLPLSPEDVSVLSCVDGRSSLQEVLGLTALPLEVAKAAMDRLVENGVVGFDPGSVQDRSPF